MALSTASRLRISKAAKKRWQEHREHKQSLSKTTTISGESGETSKTSTKKVGDLVKEVVSQNPQGINLNDLIAGIKEKGYQSSAKPESIQTYIRYVAGKLCSMRGGLFVNVRNKVGRKTKNIISTPSQQVQTPTTPSIVLPEVLQIQLQNEQSRSNRLNNVVMKLMECVVLLTQ